MSGLAAFWRSQRLQDGVQEEALGQRALNVGFPIDDGSGNGEDAKLVGEFGEFRGFNAVGADQITFHRELVCQAHGRRAVGSGGCGEDLQVKRLGQLG